MHIQWIIPDCVRNHETISRCIKVILWHLRLFRVEHKTINNERGYNIWLTEFMTDITLNLKSFQFLYRMPRVKAHNIFISHYCLEPHLVPSSWSSLLSSVSLSVSAYMHQHLGFLHDSPPYGSEFLIQEYLCRDILQVINCERNDRISCGKD